MKAESSETIAGSTNQGAGTISGHAGPGEDENDLWRGQMPPKIDEGEEPPYRSILPT